MDAFGIRDQLIAGYRSFTEGFVDIQDQRIKDAVVELGDKGRMLVDIVHSIDSMPAMVFDAKYKAASPSGAYPNADHYQMLAYCTALDVRTAWLVYAGPGQARTRCIRNSEVSVVEYPVDLSQTPEDLLARVQKLSMTAFEEWRSSQRNSALSAS